MTLMAKAAIYKAQVGQVFTNKNPKPKTNQMS